MTCSSVKSKLLTLLNAARMNCCPLITWSIKRLRIEDVDRIVKLRESIDEFYVRSDARDILEQSMESNASRTYITEENGMITSCVSTTAENSMSAMIVGVCTRRNIEGKVSPHRLCSMSFRMF